MPRHGDLRAEPDKYLDEYNIGIKKKSVRGIKALLFITRDGSRHIRVEDSAKICGDREVSSPIIQTKNLNRTKK